MAINRTIHGRPIPGQGKRREDTPSGEVSMARLKREVDARAHADLLARLKTEL